MWAGDTHSPGRRQHYPTTPAGLYCRVGSTPTATFVWGSKPWGCSHGP